MKKIAVDTVRKILSQRDENSTYTFNYMFEDQVIPVVFRTSLSLSEKGAFVARVLTGCFDDDGNYFPEYMLPVYRATVLQMCSNLPVLSVRGSKTPDGYPALDIESMSKLYELLDVDHQDHEALHSMLDEMSMLCHEAIEWRKKKISSAAELVKQFGKTIQVAAASLENLDQEKVVELANTLDEYLRLMAESNPKPADSPEIPQSATNDLGALHQ